MTRRYRSSQNPFTTAILNWFDDGCCDVMYLDLWHDVPVSYTSGQTISSDWHTDHYELAIGRDSSGSLFQKAADQLMRYRFYPPHVLTPLGDFDLDEPRWVQVGDRIVHRVHLIKIFDFNILDLIAMVEVSQTTSQERCYGFTYVTVATHFEQGEWSAHVVWEENDDVVIAVDAVSRPNPQEPGRNHQLMRSRQKRAHQKGLAHFKQTVLAI